MEKQFDLVVYIGRFQPVHTAHIVTLNYARSIAQKTLVVIGSSNNARSPKNPWTERERQMMIEASLDYPDDVSYEYVRDYAYDDNQWICAVGEAVAAHTKSGDRIAVIGHDKDHSTFYLNYFPHWSFVEMEAYPPRGETIDATKIRNLMFNGNYAFIQGVVTEKVYQQIQAFMDTPEFQTLQEDWQYIQDYRKSWAGAPFPPTFITCDAVVVQSGHVLLIQRGASPGKGLWAMPGGFIEVHEKIEDSIIRELREETRLKVPEKVLRGSIRTVDVYDDPQRSSRGRTVTHVYGMRLDDAAKLPPVRGGDDAAHAQWAPITEFYHMENQFFEDHWHIINHTLNKMI